MRAVALDQVLNLPRDDSVPAVSQPAKRRRGRESPPPPGSTASKSAEIDNHLPVRRAIQAQATPAFDNPELAAETAEASGR